MKLIGLITKRSSPGQTEAAIHIGAQAKNLEFDYLNLSTGGYMNLIIATFQQPGRPFGPSRQQGRAFTDTHSRIQPAALEKGWIVCGPVRLGRAIN